MNEKIKQAIEKIRELDLYDLHSEDFDNILGALNNMEELIKGKDEYIAKLCCDRAELKEHEKELIAEQHRLFDLAKEQEEALKIISKKKVNIYYASILNNRKDYNISVASDDLTQTEFDLVKKAVDEYGKEEN